MKTIKVTGCKDCYFKHSIHGSSELGRCVIGGGTSSGLVVINRVNIPDNCPLKNKAITIKLSE